MGDLAFKRAPEFVISTGDNFYQRAWVGMQAQRSMSQAYHCAGVTGL